MLLGEHSSSALQLERTLPHLQKDNDIVKVAGFSFMNKALDYTLDPIKVINQARTTVTEAFFQYKDEVKKFNPDLVISDYEMYTSLIAEKLSLPLWHYSTALLKHSISLKDVMTVGKHSSYLNMFIPDTLFTDLSSLTTVNFVPSHFGDMGLTLRQKKGFYWIRPYHKLANHDQEQISFVATTSKENKHMFHFLKQQENALLISNTKCHYPFSTIKPSINDGNYIKASKIFVCDGNAFHAADGFYNGKYTIFFVHLDHSSKDELFNGLLSMKHFSGVVYHRPEKIEPDIHWNKQILGTTLDPDIFYLHEEIERWRNNYGRN